MSLRSAFLYCQLSNTSSMGSPTPLLLFLKAQHQSLPGLHNAPSIHGPEQGFSVDLCNSTICSLGHQLFLFLQCASGPPTPQRSHIWAFLSLYTAPFVCRKCMSRKVLNSWTADVAPSLWASKWTPTNRAHILQAKPIVSLLGWNAIKQSNGHFINQLRSLEKRGRVCLWKGQQREDV